MNGAVAAGSLVRSHVVSGAGLNGLVALFDSPKWQVISDPEDFFCPLDNDAVDAVLFAYASGPAVDVSIKLSGCRFATNGDRTVAGTALAGRLASLVGSPTG